MTVTYQSLSSILSMFYLFPWGVAAGALIALSCSIMGFFALLRRNVFIGITLSEVAACGVALSLAMGIPPFAGSLALCVAVTLFLVFPPGRRTIPGDAVLGIIFVLASSMAVLLVWKNAFSLRDVKALLYGDLILAGPADLRLLLSTLLPATALFLLFFRPIYYTFLDRDAAHVMGINTRLWELIYFFALSIAVSAASKTAGALLTFCFLVLPASTGLVLSNSLHAALAYTMATAIFGLFAGLFVSFAWDLPANQAIAAVSCLFFFCAWTVKACVRGFR